MDLTNLCRNHTKLISYMQSQGYSESYICMVKNEIDRILRCADSNTWRSYLDIYQEYKGKSKRSRMRKATVIGLIARFDMEGLYPDGQWHKLWKRSTYEKLLPDFKSLVDFYKKLPGLSALRKTTLTGNISCLSGFLFSLQEMGCTCLDEITETRVLRYFSRDGSKPDKSAGHKNRIKAILAACAGYSDSCIRISSSCPPIHSRRKNIQYITEKEVMLLKSCIEESTFPRRDRAIIYLLIYTGMRACDIAGLTFSSFDWASDRIIVMQRKTGHLLELPLLPIPGNAVFDYLEEERPDSSDTHIFLRNLCPYTALTSGGICSLVNRAMAKAGIRLQAGDRKGSHIFRHHAVTTMLGKGVSMPVISKAMGHMAPDSLEPYSYADFPHLKSCALSIEKYPVREEVFLI